jgi:hypothetical protein
LRSWKNCARCWPAVAIVSIPSLPPLLFVILNARWGVQGASGASLALAVVIALYRLLRRQSLLYALGGAGGVAALIAHLLGRAEGFLLPTIISGAFTVLLCLVSVVNADPSGRRGDGSRDGTGAGDRQALGADVALLNGVPAARLMATIENLLPE